ncbi:MAG: chitobiase/beta-hexosaminidase C-terminal domain-containing protein, partial [Bacteroidaceae bacterium]|nr:chitobiase/beta-hexosaminidase C-terminal domain-containing protein [Bacteroidaceae bacterium]
TVSDVNDVKASLIRTRRIIFTPATELKDELRNTSINITCYDREGNIVKQVTSSDPGTVEDNNQNGNENQNENENGNQNGNQNGNENQNENQNQGSLASPVISGLTPFEETTEVTITGPDGAEIRYTTDGSTPTSESSLYSEAVTLSDTATVKAIAIKDGQTSEVSSKLFTKGNGDSIED